MSSSIFSSMQSDIKITESCRIKYPHMIPIRISPQQGITCTKNKFLMSQNITGSELQRKLTQYIKRQGNSGLYFFIADQKRHRMLQKDVTMKQIYGHYKDQEGYLNIKIYKQNVFGS